MRSVVRCGNCRLNQFSQELCRRCKMVLPEGFVISETPFSACVRLPTIEEVEKHLIAEALRRTGGNGVLAAQMIGMGKTTIYRKIAGA